jgi:hypothetical protein
LKNESNSRKSDISRTNDDGLTEVIDCRRQQNVLGRTFYGGKGFALGCFNAATSRSSPANVRQRRNPKPFSSLTNNKTVVLEILSQDSSATTG